MQKVLMEGKKNWGVVGTPTPFKTKRGTSLFVGDVVAVTSKEQYHFENSFVVEEDGKPFIMGIVNVCNGETGQIGNGWTVDLTKKYYDTLVGETYDEIVVTEDTEIKVGKNYMVIKNRESMFGGCRDLIDIEGQAVEVIKEVTTGHFRIKDKFGETHICEACNLEQLNNNLKESDSMKKNFKVGDKVRVISKIESLGTIGKVSLGDTAVIEDDRGSYNNSYRIRMDKDNDFWFVKETELELIEDKSKLEIITEGTTTKVEFEDGRTGTAKLYYKDTYNKGFGIVTALGKALGIDLVKEVTQIVGGYKLIGVDLATDATMKVSATKFKVGDIVRGIDCSLHRYGVTNEKMTKAEVINANDDETIDVIIKEYKDDRYIGQRFAGLESKYFELVKEVKSKFVVGCKVKIPKTKTAGGNILTSVNIKEAKEKGQDYLFLTEIDEDGYYVLAAIDNKGRGDFFALEDLELYEEPKSKFKVGDIIKGINKSIYSITDKDMTKGEVIDVDDSKIKVKILEHSNEDNIGNEWWVEPKYFELVEHKKPTLKEEPEKKLNVKFKKGDKVSLTKSIEGTSNQTGKGNIATIKSVNDDDYTVIMDKDGKDWFAYDTDLELFEEEKTKTPVFKIGDKIRVKTGLVVGREYDNMNSFVSEMKKYEGKIATIKEVHSRGMCLEGFEWSWTPSMLEKVEEEKVIVTKFKTGDKVKMISEHPKHDFGDVKTGDIGVVSIMREDGTIKVDFPNQKFWTAEAEELELVKEEVEEFKIGEYIYIDFLGRYNACRIEKIDEHKGCWGFWTENIKELPKAISEFNALKKDKSQLFSIACKKLSLIDDTKLKIKIDEAKLKVNKNLWNKFVSGKIKIYCEKKEEAINLLKYCEEQGLLWESGKKPTSIDYFSGYDDTYSISNGIQHGSHKISGYRGKEVISFTKLFTPLLEVGDKIDRDKAIEILRAGGKIKDYEGWIYFEDTDGTLKYKKPSREICISCGYRDALCGNLYVETLPESKYSIGQTVDHIEAEKIVKAGGRVLNIRSNFEYFLRNKELYFDDLHGHILSSGGFSDNFNSDFKIVSL